MPQKVIMEQEAGFSKLLSNLILNQCNTHLEIEKIKKESLELYDFTHKFCSSDHWVLDILN